MYRLTKFGIVLTAVALSYWPAPILAGTTLPYRDLVKGAATTSPTPDPRVFIQTLSGTGVATHFGPFTMLGGETLTFTTPTGGVVSGGTFTNTITKDGSTVSGTFYGAFTLLPTGGRKLVLFVTVTQGTGRLLGVTGLTTTTVIGDAAGNFTYTSVGTLTFP
jgi:hypothetical protein